MQRINTTLKEEKQKKSKKSFTVTIKVPKISSSHRKSNREGKQSVFHHFYPALPVSLTLCSTR